MKGANTCPPNCSGCLLNIRVWCSLSYHSQISEHLLAFSGLNNISVILDEIPSITGMVLHAVFHQLSWSWSYKALSHFPTTKFLMYRFYLVHQPKLCCPCTWGGRIWLLSLDTSQIKKRENEGARNEHNHIISPPTHCPGCLAKHSVGQRRQQTLSSHLRRINFTWHSNGDILGLLFMWSYLIATFCCS